MELKKNNIIDTPSSSILKKYSMIVNTLNTEYLYLDISHETFNNIVLSVIEKSKNEYNDEIAYSAYLKKKIREAFVQYINSHYKSDKEIVKIANSFIDTKFRGPKSDEYIIFYLTRLNELFDELDYVPNPDVIIDIVSNNKLLNKIIEIYVNNKLNKIKSFNNELLNESIVARMIDAYCEIYQVDKLNEEDNSVNDDKDDKDSITDIDSLKLYFDEIRNIPPLTVQEEEKYGYEMLNGSKEARDKLITHNLKLVATIARRYAGLDIPMNDLLQDGNEGLLMAANKYDVRKQYRFATYASWWIKHRIIKSLTYNSRTIRISESEYKKLNTYQIEFRKLQNELGRIPTDKEVADRMNTSVEEVNNTKKLLEKPLSLNEYISKEKDTELSELIVSDDTMEEDVIISNLPKEVLNMLKMCNLKEKEIKLLILRYGLNGDSPRTLQDIGNELGNISRERVRQLEAVALKKIRMSPYIKDFAIYMDHPDSAIKRIDKYRKEYSESVLNSRTLKLPVSIDNGHARGYNVVKESKCKTRTR